MTTEQKQQVIDLLKSKLTEIYPADYISVYDDFSCADDIYNIIDDNGGFNVDIVYYANAIAYLQKNDPSLRESLELASEFGFDAKSLNSEVLASLLASQYARDEFSEIAGDIDDLISSFEDETEE